MELDFRAKAFESKFKKSEILRGRGNFQKILTQGSRLSGKWITCSYIAALNIKIDVRKAQVGFFVNSKLYKAVVRNRLKRLMRESYRHLKHLLESDLQRGTQVQIVFSVKFVQDVPSYKDVYADTELLLREIRIKLRQV